MHVLSTINFITANCLVKISETELCGNFFGSFAFTNLIKNMQKAMLFDYVKIGIQFLIFP